MIAGILIRGGAVGGAIYLLRRPAIYLPTASERPEMLVSHTSRTEPEPGSANSRFFPEKPSMRLAGNWIPTDRVFENKFALVCVSLPGFRPSRRFSGVRYFTCAL